MFKHYLQLFKKKHPNGLRKAVGQSTFHIYTSGENIVCDYKSAKANGEWENYFTLRKGPFYDHSIPLAEARGAEAIQSAERMIEILPTKISDV